MSDSGKNIVFVEKLVADRLANIQRAIRRAKTWGEFKDLVWAKTYEEILDHQIENEQWYRYEVFLEDEELENGEDARSEYENYEQRIPSDNDPFHQYQIWGYADGWWPGWPEGMMVYWIPESIQKKFAQREASLHDGPALWFSVFYEKAIVAEFRKQGYEVKKDQKLVTDTAGH